jgi:hypothetical protein
MPARRPENDVALASIFLYHPLAVNRGLHHSSERSTAMIITRTLALLAAALLFLAPAARAQQRGQRYLPSYISFSGGVYAPEAADLVDNGADDGYAFFINSGYMVNQVAGLQIDLGYFGTSGDHNLQVSAFPLALSIKLALPGSVLEPYVIGGYGVYFTDTSLDLGSVSIDDTGTEFGPHAGGGLNLNFGKYQFGVEARYIWLEASGLDVDGWLFMGKIGSRF